MSENVLRLKVTSARHTEGSVQTSHTASQLELGPRLSYSSQGRECRGWGKKMLSPKVKTNIKGNGGAKGERWGK